jgi:heme/copper-type cytochrome/quinol oxidase subunit 3
MTVREERLEQPLTRQEKIALKNKRTGMTLFQISWILVFVCLVVVYAQMRSGFVVWPPEGIQPVSIVPGLAASLALFASAWLTWRGLNAARAGEMHALVQQWTIALALGAAFIVIVGAQWAATPVDNPYGTLFRVLVGYHLVHAVVIGAYMLSVLFSARAGELAQRDLWPAEAAAKLWYFVVIAWVLFFIPLYLL